MKNALTSFLKIAGVVVIASAAIYASVTFLAAELQQSFREFVPSDTLRAARGREDVQRLIADAVASLRWALLAGMAGAGVAAMLWTVFVSVLGPPTPTDRADRRGWYSQVWWLLFLASAVFACVGSFLFDLNGAMQQATLTWPASLGAMTLSAVLGATGVYWVGTAVSTSGAARDCVGKFWTS